MAPTISRSKRETIIAHRICRFLVAAGVCLLGAQSVSLAQLPAKNDVVGWVGLFTGPLIGWLENQNRLDELCSHAEPGSSQKSACRQEMLAPKQFVIELRDAPRPKSKSLGAIVVEATPGQGLRASYRPAIGQTGVDFSPDLLDVDWGYGPYFHQTFLDRRGTWFLLPADPFPQPVWINAAWLREEPRVRLLEAGDIIRAPKGDLFVLGVSLGILSARAEQKADMWCEEGAAPPLKPAPEFRIPVEELYGPGGHLRVGIKYTRGC